MAIPSHIGTAARSVLLKSASLRARSEITKLSVEATTGQAANISTHLRGDSGPLALIDLRLARVSTHIAALTSAGTEYQMVQDALARITGAGQRIFDQIAATFTSEPQPDHVAQFAASAIKTVDEILSVLSSQYAGRALFSGAQVDTAPFPSGSDFMLSIEALLQVGAAPSEILADIDTIFEAPNGVVSQLLYLGGPAVPGPQLGDGSMTPARPLAIEPEFLEVLKMAVIGTRMSSAGLSTADAAQYTNSVLSIAPNALKNLVALRGRVGLAQENIENHQIKLESEKFTLTNSRLGMVGVDQFEAATNLEAARSELESIYMIIARVSQLSLLGFLR